MTKGDESPVTIVGFAAQAVVRAELTESLGAIAMIGDASICLRLSARADYVEKIWDHAAGRFVVEQAGGMVTDVDVLDAVRSVLG